MFSLTIVSSTNKGEISILLVEFIFLIFNLKFLTLWFEDCSLNHSSFTLALLKIASVAFPAFMWFFSLEVIEFSFFLFWLSTFSNKILSKLLKFIVFLILIILINLFLILIILSISFNKLFNFNKIYFIDLPFSNLCKLIIEESKLDKSL